MYCMSECHVWEGVFSLEDSVGSFNTTPSVTYTDSLSHCPSFFLPFSCPSSLLCLHIQCLSLSLSHVCSSVTSSSSQHRQHPSN